MGFVSDMKKKAKKAVNKVKEQASRVKDEAGRIKDDTKDSVVGVAADVGSIGATIGGTTGSLLGKGVDYLTNDSFDAEKHLTRAGAMAGSGMFSPAVQYDVAKTRTGINSAGEAAAVAEFEADKEEKKQSLIGASGRRGTKENIGMFGAAQTALAGVRKRRVAHTTKGDVWGSYKL